MPDLFGFHLSVSSSSAILACLAFGFFFLIFFETTTTGSVGDGAAGVGSEDCGFIVVEEGEGLGDPLLLLVLVPLLFVPSVVL